LNREDADWLKPGMVVKTADGAELGHVKELGPASFKIDAPLSLDYWLPYEAVVRHGAPEDEEAVTTFMKDELPDHVVDSPDDTFLT
jgi:hypothetical protein